MASGGHPRRVHAGPRPQQVIDHPDTIWTRLTLPWYGQPKRTIEIASATAVWYHTGLPPVPIRFVLIRDVLGKFKPQALLSTDLHLTALLILTFFMRRWQMEPTFQQVRAHLGVETQRQWSDRAIARTTPVLLGLFALITILADTLITRHGLTVRTAAWYPETLPAFSDAIALVRRALWSHLTFQISLDDADSLKVPRVLLERFNDLLCYAA